MIAVGELNKTFTLHPQGGVTLPVLRDVDLEVMAGECVVLVGPSGAGKSTLLRSIYANYKPQAGRIQVRHGAGMVDMMSSEPRRVLEVRRFTMGYVSQFLRVVPRVPAIDVVAEPARAAGIDRDTARARAATLLARLAIPERLWALPPATFSGGEQQRVNIARGFSHDYPILLLDEPTASLDARNRDTVIALIREATERGAAIVAICHDEDVRAAIATRLYDLRPVVVS